MAKVSAFEEGLLAYMHAEHGEWMVNINQTGAYNEEIEQQMRSAIEKFKPPQHW